LLSELSIKDFAIIEELHVSFEEGMTVLTGETGAGKSIIIGAIQLLAGGRGSHQFVRHGAKKAEIEGMFRLKYMTDDFRHQLTDLGIDWSDDYVFVIRRDISASGKSTCRINGTLVTIAMLREVMRHLIDIHSQHENQSLMDERYHIHLLDQFAGEDFKKTFASYTEMYQRYKKYKRQLEEQMLDERQVAQQIDIYSFQLNEINEAQLEIGEEEKLLQEQTQLKHFDRIYSRLGTAYEALSNENHGLDWIGSAMSDLEDAATVDESLETLAETTTSNFYALQDVAHQLSDILSDMEFNPSRLEEVESRLALIGQLQRKYGETIEDILIYRESIADELDRLVHRDERLAEVEEKFEQVKQDLMIEAEELSIIRKQNAEQLKVAIERQLADLQMGKAQFDVRIERKEKDIFDAFGYDHVAFYISTNVGEPFMPLVQVASGGELSRVMLALKTIFSVHEGVLSIIFDEVDTGVGGRAAQAIADKMTMIAHYSQVLCISHLPQVAAMADHHYVIEKEVEDGRTFTRIRAVEEEKREEELSRMLSGAEVTPLTLRHAAELITLGKERKRAMADDE